MDSAILVEYSIVDSYIITFKINNTTCAFNGLHTLQDSIHRQTFIINYQVLLALFQFNINLLVGDRNAIACSKGYACNFILYKLHVGYRSLISFVNLCYVCIFGCYAVQTSQFFVQLYLYISTIIAYFDIIVSTAEFYGITSSYLSCRTVICCYCPAFTNFGCQIIYFFVGCVQLTKVDCIGVISAICYAGNLLVICVQTAAGDVRLVNVAYAFVFIHEEVASFYAVYSQIRLQCYLNIFTSISYCDISTITFEGNSIIICAIRANLHSSFFITICSKFPALIHYLLQLSFCSSRTFIISEICITNFCIS